MKYIMLDNHIPIVFPDSLTHKEVADRLSVLHKTTSAGMVGARHEATGRSVSLRMHPARTDTAILDMFFTGSYTSLEYLIKHDIMGAIVVHKEVELLMEEHKQ